MPERPSGGPGAASADTPVAELVQRATEQITQLVRDELTMARAEMTAKGKRAGVGVGLFGGGGALALYAGAALTVAAVVALSYIIPAALAAFVVGVILAGIAALLARTGKKQVRRAAPPMPKSTAGSLRADADTVRNAAKSRGRT